MTIFHSPFCFCLSYLSSCSLNLPNVHLLICHSHVKTLNSPWPTELNKCRFIYCPTIHVFMYRYMYFLCLNQIGLPTCQALADFSLQVFVLAIISPRMPFAHHFSDLPPVPPFKRPSLIILLAALL